ncbi:MAG: VanZ family protein [Phycisphaerales bacterium]|nr:VanZ family protein [Phycisphaerales bacterium]
MNQPASPWRTPVRIAWALYTLALLTATHWPGLVVDGPVDWIDKIIHCGVFCIWTCLFYMSGLVLGQRRLLWTVLIGFGYAIFDETTQPMFDRVFDLLDLAADALGVLLAAGLITATRRVWPRFRGDLAE